MAEPQDPGNESPPDLFHGICFTVVLSDDIDKVEAAIIRDSITSRGGSFVPIDDSNNIQNLQALTHILSTHVDFPEYNRAIDLNVNVVKPNWIIHSIAKNKIANTRQYSPDPSQFFNDVVICTANLPQGDKDSIEAACLAMGGMYSGPMQRQVTHLVTTDEDHDKVRIVRQKRLTTKVVLPHWIDDCIKLGKRISEGPYTFPDPEILRRENQSIPRANFSPFIDGATSATPNCLPEHCLPASPSDLRKNLNAFMSKRVMLAKDLSLGDRVRSTLIDLIQHGGGTLTENAHEADIYVGHWREGSDYVTASRGSACVGNLAWLYHVINQNRWTCPTSKLLFYPLPRRGLPGFEHMIISISNYSGDARTYLENLITASGATFTKTMKLENTHLITAHKTSEKCDAAQEWNINIVNHLWLEESYAKCSVQSLTNPRYTHFPSRINLGAIVGQASLDNKSLERLYFSKKQSSAMDPPRTLPSQLSPAKIISSLPPGSSLVEKDLPSSEQGVQLEQSPLIPENDISTQEPTAKSRSRTPKSISASTPRPHIAENKENESPILQGSNRASKTKAMSSLHAQAADIELFQKEMKRKGGVIHGRERRSSHVDESVDLPTAVASRQGRKRKSDEVTYDVTAQGSDLSDGETQDQPRPTKRGKKVEGLPPIQYRLMVTGDPRWHEKPSTESADKSKLRALGVQLITEPKDVDFLIAPRILRTKKFIAAIAFAPTIVTPEYLDYTLKNNSLPPKPQLLTDPQGEEEYGFRLQEAVERAELNSRKLLRGWTIFVTREITGGFDTYKEIVTLNGGTALMYQGRTGLTIPPRRISPDEDPQAGGESQHQGGKEECDYVYLVSGDSDVEVKRWKTFKAVCEKQQLKARIVKTDWLLNSCMSQQIYWNQQWEWDEVQ